MRATRRRSNSGIFAADHGLGLLTLLDILLCSFLSMKKREAPARSCQWAALLDSSVGREVIVSPSGTGSQSWCRSLLRVGDREVSKGIYRPLSPSSKYLTAANASL